MLKNETNRGFDMRCPTVMKDPHLQLVGVGSFGGFDHACSDSAGPRALRAACTWMLFQIYQCIHVNYEVMHTMDDCCQSAWATCASLPTRWMLADAVCMFSQVSTCPANLRVCDTFEEKSLQKRLRQIVGNNAEHRAYVKRQTQKRMLARWHIGRRFPFH
jgi:hypothetical protein